MRTSLELRDLIAADTLELQLLRATLPMRALISLLDAVIESHLVDLATVTPDQLRHTQGAIKQLQCLRRVLLDDNPNLSPKA
jgi:hypothetical protein